MSSWSSFVGTRYAYLHTRAVLFVMVNVLIACSRGGECALALHTSRISSIHCMERNKSSIGVDPKRK